ncbi:MAG TPA: metallophosphoesterase [Gemmatimonadaceae bacterium]|nr:metallophosphoesterase [Gemmatimonadaceae bacterium]
MPTPVRIAAISDPHVSTKTTAGAFHTLFSQIADAADVLVVCGDLTDYGLPEEARILARELATLRIPVIGVLGNHDFESGQEGEVRRILADAGVVMLDGESHETHGVGFAGIKGFCGGFGRGVLGAWGEPAVKQFAHEAVAESLKLESALARLRTPQRIAILHYAPVRGTVEGEPVEIFPYLGCSRHEEPLLRYPVTAVFHGHAHGGSPEGATSNGIPVYNVAMPLLKKHFPDRPAFRVIEVDAEAPGRDGNGDAYTGPERRKG